MKQQSGEMSTCQSCGASVYPEHLDSGIARYEDGKLLCAHCVKDFERERAAGGADKTEVLETIHLESDAMDSSDSVGSGTTEMSSSRIHGMSTSTLGHHAGADVGPALKPNGIMFAALAADPAGTGASENENWFPGPDAEIGQSWLVWSSAPSLLSSAIPSQAGLTLSRYWTGPSWPATVYELRLTIPEFVVDLAALIAWIPRPWAWTSAGKG